MKLLFASVLICLASCQNLSKNKNSTVDSKVTAKLSSFDLNKEIKNCEAQLNQAVPKLTDLSKHPRLIETNETEWKEISNGRLVWTSGFYPGILWYMYDLTKEEKWKAEAIKRTEVFEDFKTINEHHDIGFMMFPAYGNGYIFGDKKEYKDILLTSAESLASRFNPKVGTIRSWSNKMHPRWQQHITIIDNMLNLELLFWAAKNGGSKEFYDIAVKHAETTMENHFRPDYTSWHVIEYDSITGKVLNRHTKQGYADDSRWSRGQAWGIYGYTMVYRETGDKKFLEFAEKLTDKYLELLPEDYIPHWDFDVPNLENEERDASAAAIVASCLLELSTLVEDKMNQERYYNAAMRMMESLSSEQYSGVGKTDSFLVHSTGAKSLGHEIDVALIYADYYYIEALDRLQKMAHSK
ncbi:glycoside hydrolase family 88 protein [Arenibacter sp. BSSL-BM3]|uniref:Glycoside hydrolase family 88 protein n=1 Tax=Arenibacter arenosicollis TaxID=2762274 RepID=A0ABR7QIQ6_9FLAO|nr:glycoside hydrolase family 88 protein [Arenibacter arenosicollis]MBC8767076.1 glycoside hydrolase family 88 protein [Arenibacter arenosicollis]